MANRDVRTLTEARALAAMANPYRSRILDALKVDGPSTSSALARRTGQAVGSVSHHVRVLAEAGLVEEAAELAKDRRERWWRLTSRSTRWSRAEFADDPQAVSAALAAENLALARQFARAQEWQDNFEAEGDWGGWWRLTSRSTRWSRAEFADDPQAVSAALAAENLALARQFARAQEWQDNFEAEGDWGDAAFATQTWLRLSPDELRELSRAMLELIASWSAREIPDDEQTREPIFLFARAFPAQP